MDLNKVLLIGNLTRDVELRYLSTGTAVTDLGLAVNNRIKKNDEWVDEPCFVSVTVWARNAENCSQYLSKGSGLLVEGRLKFDSWEKDGQKRSKLSVVADRIQFMPRSGGGGQGGGEQGGGGKVSNHGSNFQGGGQESGPASSSEPQSYHDDSVPF